MRKTCLILAALLGLSAAHSPVAAQRVSNFVSPVVAVPGVTPRSSKLTDFSLGNLDPSKPTFVVTHGWNPLPNRFRLSTPEAYAQKIRSRHGDAVNVLAFHWDSRGQGSPQGNTANAMNAGRRLGTELLSLGIAPEQTTLIGHSMGSVVVSSTAHLVYGNTGRRLKKLVLIDAPKWKLSVISNLRPNVAAAQVTNVWANGPSGMGAPIEAPGIINLKAPDRRPRRGNFPWPNPARNNHIDAVLWYYETFL